MGENGLHGIYSDDVGEACASMFADENSKYIGRKVALSGELLKSGDYIAKTFEEAFPGKKFRYENPTKEDYLELCQKAGFGDALSRMYGFYSKRMPRGADLTLTKELHPNVKTLAQYLRDCSSDFKFEK